MSELVRANKVTIQPMGDNYEARFFRTHKLVSTIQSTDTSWTPNDGDNKTAQRESFRKWVCDNAEGFGIQWLPNDLRPVEYKVPNRYDTDELLITTAINLVMPDIRSWVDDIGDPTITLQGIGAEDITPVTKTPKGAEVNSKYNSGCWAWAKVKLSATVVKHKDGNDIESYVDMTVDLVSGQLKKPTKLGDSGYNKTGLRTELSRDLPIDSEVKQEATPEPEPESKPDNTDTIPDIDIDNIQTKKTKRVRKNKDKVAQ